MSPYLEGKRSGPHSYLLYGKCSMKLFIIIVQCTSLLHKVKEPQCALPSPVLPRMRTVYPASPLVITRNVITATSEKFLLLC